MTTLGPFKHVDRLVVSIDIEPTLLEVGTLAWKRSERRAYFQFNPEFIASGLPISPFGLKNSAGLIPAPHQPFDGLHGLFNDSLPDGWGRRVLDRSLQSRRIDPLSMTPLDRLTFVGARGMGALIYVPDKSLGQKRSELLDLDWMAQQAALFDEEVDVADIDKLEALNGGSAGARPKVMVGFDERRNRVVGDSGGRLPSGYERYIVKFRSPNDPAEIGAEEYAYALMAADAGVDMPTVKLMRASTGARFFAAKRFDRTANGRCHVHTVSGLLDADHRIPSMDYSTLLKATWALTKSFDETKQMFRRMVFNVLARNRDDHPKNHAFMMRADGTWSVTPAYDLTLSSGPGGEHSLAVDGEGRNPSRKHIMAVAKEISISKGDAGEIVDQVKATVLNWPRYASNAGLSDRRTSEIHSVLNGTG